MLPGSLGSMPLLQGVVHTRGHLALVGSESAFVIPLIVVLDVPALLADERLVVHKENL
jgi:hypothetical protein